MSWIVKNPSAATSIFIVNLGNQEVPALSEIDLQASYSFEAIKHASEDVTTVGAFGKLIADGALRRLDQPGGIVVPPGSAYDDAVVPHTVSHEAGGLQPLNVAGLSGLLATPQTPATHTHGGADITSQVGDADTVDGQHAAAFATAGHTHADLPTAAQKAALDASAAPATGNPLITQSALDQALSNKVWQDPVLNVLLAPPVSPATGDRYLVGDDTTNPIGGTATGAWAAHEGEIAEYNGTGWDFSAPADSWHVSDNDSDRTFKQTAAIAPWVWRADTSGTATHGDEKHTYVALKAGGNRSDANLDTLTGAGNADALHTHAPPVFGTEHGYAESLGEQSKTSSALSQALQLTAALPAGSYHAEWCGEYYGKKDDGIVIAVEVDDTTTIFSIDPKMKKKVWFPFSGSKVLTLTAAMHTIDIDFASKKNGKEVKIRRLSIELWRVS